MSKGMILGLAGGGAALVVGIIVVVILVAGGSDENGDPNVAAQPDDQPPRRRDSRPRKPQPKVDRGNSNNSANHKDDVDSAPSTGPQKTASKTPGETPQVEEKTIANQLVVWHADPNAKLMGRRRVGDSKLVMLDYSWMCELLPHLGYEQVYRRFDFSKGFTEGRNLQTSTAIIPEFLNPADPRARWQGQPFDSMGLTHFVGMSGIEEQRNDVAAMYPRSHRLAGVFGYDAVARRNEITDGTSQTIMIIGSGELASPWVQGGGATVRGARKPYFDEISGFGSRGIDGTLAVMADGSVRKISSSVETSVFRSMCTIHGGENVDAGQLGSTQEKLLQRAE